MADRTSAPVPDGFDLKPNGTALLLIDGQQWRIRRPKLGELRKLRDLMADRDDERWQVIADHNSVEVPDKPAEDAPMEDKRAFLRSQNRRATSLTDAVVQLNIDWMVEAMTILADKPLPSPDDWPSGMETFEMTAALFEHWRSVPLRSGGG